TSRSSAGRRIQSSRQSADSGGADSRFRSRSRGDPSSRSCCSRVSSSGQRTSTTSMRGRYGRCVSRLFRRGERCLLVPFPNTLVRMSQTLSEKVWERHVVDRAEGEPDLLYVDLHLVHEVTSPQAFDGLRLHGRTVRRPDLTISTIDHNNPTT